MDFDVSTASVTDAFGELQRKLQSVREDTELFSSLEKKACASFERHRAEMTLLLQKERAIHAAAEDRLREELQRLLQENETARAQMAALRAERERRCCEETRAERERLQEREERARLELSGLREEAAAARAEADAVLRERTWHEIQLREALERQGALREELQRLRREAEEAEEARAERERLEERRRRHSAHCSLEKVFLPSGPPDQQHSTSPASHHIAAIVSTVERQNFYRPRMYYRRRGISSPMQKRLESSMHHNTSATGKTQPAPLLTESSLSSSLAAKDTSAALSLKHTTANCSTTSGKSFGRGVTAGSGRYLAALCHSLLREIFSMRKEYQECAASLDDPSTNSVALSRRMRSIVADLDRKVLQLRGLRQQQANVEDKLRLHDMMMEIAAENGYCESIYSDLLELIRS